MTDQEIISDYQKNGEPARLSELYNRYAALIYGLCLKYLKDRELAKDAVSDIFEILIEKLSTEEIQYFKSWLYTVSRNYCLMQLRKKNSEMNERFMDFEPSMHLNDETDLEEDLVALETCVDELKAEQKTCVKLFFLQKMSYQQIVKKTMIDLKKVKSHIQNGKRNLKICLEEKNVRREKP